MLLRVERVEAADMGVPLALGLAVTSAAGLASALAGERADRVERADWLVEADRVLRVDSGVCGNTAAATEISLVVLFEADRVDRVLDGAGLLSDRAVRVERTDLADPAAAGEGVAREDRRLVLRLLTGVETE